MWSPFFTKRLLFFRCVSTENPRWYTILSLVLIRNKTLFGIWFNIIWMLYKRQMDVDKIFCACRNNTWLTTFSTGGGTHWSDNFFMTIIFPILAFHVRMVFTHYGIELKKIFENKLHTFSYGYIIDPEQC